MTIIPAGFRGAATKLTVADIEFAATTLGVEPELVWSVSEVESTGRGFLADGRPALLFEAHWFSKLTGGVWDASHPGVSEARYPPHYGEGGGHQYDRLAEAMALNPEAALQAATWGMFQILGVNFKLVGFPDIDSFVAAMCGSEGAQLAAFVAYCRGKGLVRFLASHDWENFKIGYNGSGADDYAAKLATAYANVVYPPPGMPSGAIPAPVPVPEPTPTPPSPPPAPHPPPDPGTDPVAMALAVLTSALDHHSTDVSLAVARIVAPNPSSQTIATQIDDITARVTSLSDSIEEALAQGAPPSFRSG